MLQVTLSPEDEVWAMDVGRKRFDESFGDPRFAYTSVRSGTATHQLGAMAELAFARALKLDWPARVNTFRSQPDVDPNWEVRWSSDRDRVKVAVDDDPKILVAHVTGKNPTFYVHGCILAGAVQRDQPAIDLGGRGRKAHFISAYFLTPIDERFHLTCAWAPKPDGWACIYCGAAYDGPVPEERSWSTEPAAPETSKARSPSGRKRTKRASCASSASSTTGA